MREFSTRRSLNEERGFTLVEVLMVVIIIGILASIAIPAYLSTRKSAYDAGAQSVYHNAATAALTYRANYRTFAGLDAAALNSIEPSLPDAPGEAPYDPPDGMYTITVTGAGSDFEIDVRHSQGGTTYRSTDEGSTIPVP